MLSEAPSLESCRKVENQGCYNLSMRGTNAKHQIEGLKKSTQSNIGKDTDTPTT